VIAAAVERTLEVGLTELRSAAKDLAVARARKVFGIVASDHGYKSVELARYLGKDGSRFSRYLREREGVGKEMKEVKRIVENAR